MAILKNYAPRIGITTGVNTTEALIEEATTLSISLRAQYKDREGCSIESFFSDYPIDRLLIVRREKYTILSRDGIEYEYHPNLAIVRATNYAKIGSDHYLEAAMLQAGDRVIDCTLGFGTEAILAALVVGTEGEVIGLENVPELAEITRNGMSRYKLLQKNLQQAMRRVIVINRDYRDYLRLCPTRSAHVVYFDPFFKQALEKSAVTIGTLAAFGSRAPLDIRSITEARRVARRSVIIKHPKYHKLPEEVACLAKEVVAGRRSPVAFTVIPAYEH